MVLYLQFPLHEAHYWFFHGNYLAISSELPFNSVSKRVLVHNLSDRNYFDFLDNDHAGIISHFRLKGCAPGLVLKQS